MVRMMSYKEANRILGSSLSPLWRCIAKRTALENHAQRAPLEMFAYNRLVPVKSGSKEWVIKQYHIIYQDENGNQLKEEWCEPGQALNPPSIPGKAGYDTDGWNNGYTGYATGDAIYRPVYTARYTIKFVDWNGTVLKEETLRAGSAVTPPANPTRSGYTFSGWNPSVSPTATGNVTYTATYTQDPGPEPPTPVPTTSFYLSESSSSATWNGKSSSSYGTSSNPYIVQFGSTGGSKNAFVLSTVDSVSKNWTCEKQTSGSQSSVSVMSGVDKTGITITINPNSTGNKISEIYKFIQQDTGKTIYLKAISTSEKILNNIKYIIVQYTSYGGSDLDSATIINTSTLKNYYWGYNGNSSKITNANIKNAITWSGDATSSTGIETVTINLQQLYNNISDNQFDILMYANWFGTKKDSSGKPIAGSSESSTFPDSTRYPDIVTTTQPAIVGFYAYEDDPDSSQPVQHEDFIVGDISKGNINSTIYGATTNSITAVKDYYASVLKVTYNKSQDALSYSQEESTQGVSPTFYPCWNTSYWYNGGTASGAALKRDYFCRDTVSTSNLRVDVVSKIGSTPTPFKIFRKYSSDAYTCDVYVNGQNIGTAGSSSSAVTVNPSSAVQPIYLTFKNIPEDQSNLYFVMQQIGSPEYAECSFKIPTGGGSSYYITADNIYQDSYTNGSKSQFTVTSRDDSSNPAAFKLDSKGADWFSLYSDANCTNEITTSSSILPTEASNKKTCYAKFTENSNYTARTSTYKLSNAGDTTASEKVVQAGKLLSTFNYSADLATITSQPTRADKSYIYSGSDTYHTIRLKATSDNFFFLSINPVTTINGSSASGITYEVGTLPSGISKVDGQLTFTIDNVSEGKTYSKFKIDIKQNGTVIGSRYIQITQDHK